MCACWRFRRDLPDHHSVYYNVGLKIDGVQKYSYSIGVWYLAFKNTAEILEATVIDHYLIPGLEWLKFFHKTITSNLRTNHVNDFVVDWNRLIVKTHKAMDASGKADLVVQLVEPETTEDVSREERLRQLSHLA